MPSFDLFLASPSKWPWTKPDESVCNACVGERRGYCKACKWSKTPITKAEMYEMRTQGKHYKEETHDKTES